MDKRTVDNYSKFADEYRKKLTVSIHHKFVEKPSMYSLLPNLQNKNVVCLGCGTGEEADYLARQGANVIGVDASPKMIDLARKHYPDLKFEVMDMENLALDDLCFDLVYSSLAIHYVRGLNGLMEKTRDLLRPGGIFLFSTLHPVFDVCEDFRCGSWDMNVLGEAEDTSSHKVKIFGNYFFERPVEREWTIGMTTKHYHWTLETLISAILDNGFVIEGLREPKPSSEAKVEFPKKYHIYSKRPSYLVIKCRKA